MALEVLREVDVEPLAQRLKGALPGAVGAIVNTVDRAQDLYRALGEEPLLPSEELARRLGGISGGQAWEEVRQALPERG